MQGTSEASVWAEKMVSDMEAEIVLALGRCAINAERFRHAMEEEDALEELGEMTRDEEDQDLLLKDSRDTHIEALHGRAVEMEVENGSGLTSG
jgi:hypothetical protein